MASRSRARTPGRERTSAEERSEQGVELAEHGAWGTSSSSPTTSRAALATALARQAAYADAIGQALSRLEAEPGIAEGNRLAGVP